MKLIDDWIWTLAHSAAVWFAVASFVLGAIGIALMVHGQYVYVERTALLFQLAGWVCVAIVPLARVIAQKGKPDDSAGAEK